MVCRDVDCEEIHVIGRECQEALRGGEMNAEVVGLGCCA